MPTIAINDVYILQNTSILQDEVLAHRLGLVPIRADPHLFDAVLPQQERTVKNTIVFCLDVECPQGGETI